MPEHPIILQLREVRRARVRYGRANLYIARWGDLTSGELGTALRAFQRREGGAEEVCWAFVRSRMESHTASFDFDRADLGRLVDVVAGAATEPELRARTIDALAAELVDLGTAERERVRRRRADFRKGLSSFFESSALGVMRSVQGSLDKWKLGSIYEPQLPRLAASVSQSLRARGVLGAVQSPEIKFGLGRTPPSGWIGGVAGLEAGERFGSALAKSYALGFSGRRPEGQIASLAVASATESMKASFGLGVAGGRSPGWLEAAGALGIGARIAPAMRSALAELASGFPNFDFQRHYGSLGIAAQVGRFEMSPLIKGTALSGYAGIGQLAQSQLGLLPRLPAWKDWADSFERSLPANWRELDSAEVDRAAGLMGETGLCLAWVPRAELIRALLSAPDHQARCQILAANANEILADVEGVLLEISSAELLPIAGAAEEAIRSARAGAPGPAQSHVASALGHVAHGYFGYESFAPIRKRFAGVDPVNDVGFAEFSFYAIGKAWVISIASFKQAGDGFNRNLTAHYVGAPHYSEANLLGGLMLLAGLLRELQRQERRLEARKLQPAA